MPIFPMVLLFSPLLLFAALIERESSSESRRSQTDRSVWRPHNAHSSLRQTSTVCMNPSKIASELGQ